MRKRIQSVASRGLILISVLVVAALITGSTVAAMTGLYRDTYTFYDNSCEVELYADSTNPVNPVGIWGTVTTCTHPGPYYTTTLHVRVLNEFSYENGELVEDYYVLDWYSEPEEGVAPGECYTIPFSADGAFIGSVKITWSVYHFWYPFGPIHNVVRTYFYTGSIWDPNQEWVKGIIGNAETGYPIPYATVLIEKSGEDDIEVTTDYYGRYDVMLPAPGLWTITASKTGFYDEDCSVYVSKSELETRNLQLDPIGGGPGPL